MPVAAVPSPAAPEIRGATAVAPQPRVVAESKPVTVAQPVVAAPEAVEIAAAIEPGSAADAQRQASDVQGLAIDALRQAKQSTAADAVEDSVWTIAEGEMRIQTELSKVMLPVVLNPEAEKIVRAVVQKAGIARVTLLPGAPSEKTIKKPRAAKTGSAQARALEHPMVQQAKKLFQAEIQSVIDLREND